MTPVPFINVVTESYLDLRKTFTQCYGICLDDHASQQPAFDVAFFIARARGAGVAKAYDQQGLMHVIEVMTRYRSVDLKTPSGIFNSTALQDKKVVAELDRFPKELPEPSTTNLPLQTIAYNGAAFENKHHQEPSLPYQSTDASLNLPSQANTHAQAVDSWNLPFDCSFASGSGSRVDSPGTHPSWWDTSLTSTTGPASPTMAGAGFFGTSSISGCENWSREDLLAYLLFIGQ